MSAPVRECQPDIGHTPTPWANCEGAIFRVIDARGFTVATVASDSDLRDQWAANAAFIVEAVNNYAALQARVEELTKALQRLDLLLDFSDENIGQTWTFEDTSSIQEAFAEAHRALSVPLERSGGAT